MRQGQIAVIGPQRIGGDVGDDHWFCAVSGRPARTDGRTDDDAIDCVGVVYRQAGRCAVPEAVGVRIQQKDRRQRTAGQFFEEPANGIEDESGRIAPGYHLEKPFLFRQVRLASPELPRQMLLLGDIHCGANEALEDSLGESWNTNPPRMAKLAVGSQDALLDITT